MTETRKAIHAYLTEEGHDAWHDFAATCGVSVSGMLEAWGRDLQADMDAGVAEDKYQALIKEGRKIDALRRRRTGIF